MLPDCWLSAHRVLARSPYWGIFGLVVARNVWLDSLSFRWGIPVLAVAGDRSAKGIFGIDVGTEMFSAFTKSAFGMVLRCLWVTICFIVFCKVKKGGSQKYTLM